MKPGSPFEEAERELRSAHRALQRAVLVLGRVLERLPELEAPQAVGPRRRTVRVVETRAAQAQARMATAAEALRLGGLGVDEEAERPDLPRSKLFPRLKDLTRG